MTAAAVTLVRAAEQVELGQAVYGPGTCSVPGCGHPLSRYNPHAWCHVHQARARLTPHEARPPKRPALA